MAYPEELTCQTVNGIAVGALGKDGHVKGNVALEDERVGLLLFGRRRAKVHSPGDIGRAVQILAARVAQIDGIGINSSALPAFRLVVDDSSAGRC